MSSYAKALEGVMRLFPRKVKVAFVHAITRKDLGVLNMMPGELPERFDKPVILEALGESWRVLNADPVSADDFLFSRKLRLEVQEVGSVDPSLVGHWVPTMAANQPSTSDSSIFNDFVFDLPGHGWRQIEFMPASALDTISFEMANVESILFPEKDQNLLRGYPAMHIRKQIASQPLDLALEKFCALVAAKQKGAIRLEQGGLVKEGFSIQSDSHLYYGIIEENIIKNLCLDQFDCADDELLSVLSSFELLLVDWCKGSVMSGDMKSTEESSTENITEYQAGEVL